jgi:hypothetical protein
MNTYRATASAVVESPAQQVYAIIADYRDEHPHIIPRPPFVALSVEQGGVGAGTIVNFQMNSMGRAMNFHSTVAEPEPGRVLVETDTLSGAATTFSVDPLDGGQRARVTITTEGKARDGLPGLLERFLTPMFLKRVYVQELKLLADRAALRSRASGA